jgi:hypothetical protein
LKTARQKPADEVIRWIFMKITFRADLVDSWCNGIDVPAPIVSLDVNPSTLAEEQRELIGKHLLATDDGCNVVHDPERAKQSCEVVPLGGHPGAEFVEAKNPTLESLLKALAELESQTSLSVRTNAFCA